MPVSISGNGAITGFDPVASGFGKVLQVVSTTKTDTFTTSSGLPTYVDVTGLSVSITPQKSTSKILVLGSINVGWDANRGAYVRLVRGSTAIAIGDSAGSRTQATFMTTFDDFISSSGGARWNLNGAINFLDSPATTSATTYKLQIAGDGSDGTNVYVNRTGNDGDAAASGRTVSTITVMEIAA